MLADQKHSGYSGHGACADSEYGEYSAYFAAVLIYDSANGAFAVVAVDVGDDPERAANVAGCIADVIVYVSVGDPDVIAGVAFFIAIVVEFVPECGGGGGGISVGAGGASEYGVSLCCAG